MCNSVRHSHKSEVLLIYFNKKAIVCKHCAFLWNDELHLTNELKLQYQIKLRGSSKGMVLEAVKTSRCI